MLTSLMFKRALVLTLVAFAALPAVNAAAAARPFSQRFSENVNGQITMAANTSMRCLTNTVDTALNRRCVEAQAGTTARNNNIFDMQMADVDSDPSTFNSSKADLVLPAGAQILFAGLYWSSNPRAGTTITGTNGYVGVPTAAPDAASKGQVLITAPGQSAYDTVTASSVDAIGSGAREYGAFADVTAQVKAAGAGTYTVANIQAGTGGDRAAGWSLVVAYADPSEPLRNLTVFDGFESVTGTAEVAIPVSGFKTPTTGSVESSVGVVAYEGDAGMTGDYLTLNDNLLQDSVHPANNTENSTIAKSGSMVTTKNPNWPNQLGFDASIFATSGFLPNAATSAIFRAKTDGDAYFPHAITLATELFSPQVDLVKSASVVGGGPALPGATIRYTVTATNNGGANATNVVLDDPVPSGTALSAGPSVSAGSGNASAVGQSVTARLGSGATSTAGGTLAPGASATVTFDATIGDDRALGEVITNTATLQFVSPDLGLPISKVASAETTVSYPDPGVTKTVQSSVGGQYTFAVTVKNEGTVATSGAVQVADVPSGDYAGPYSMSGSGWTCPGSVSPCTRSDALAPGASYPPITVVANYTPGGEVINSALIASGSGGQPTNAASPALLNDKATASAGTSPLAALQVQKTSLTTNASVGGLAEFRIQVQNAGPDAATDTTVTDTLPAGLTFVSATPSQGSCSSAAGGGGTTAITCSMGTLPVSSSATVIVKARPQPGASDSTLTNGVSADSSITPTPVTDNSSVDINPIADLSLTKTADVSSAGFGDPVSYTLTATNSGPDSATNVEIVDTLPPGIDAASAVATPSSSGSCQRTGSTIACIWAGATANGASRSVTISADVASSVAAEDRQSTNLGVVSSLTDDPEPSTNQAQVDVVITPSVDLAVKATGPSQVDAGGEADILFSTVNNGPSTADDSQIVITIPSQLSVVDVPSGCKVSGSKVTCQLGSIASGETTSTTIRVKAAGSADTSQKLISAEVSTSSVDRIPSNNQDVTPLLVDPVADLRLTKSVTPTTANPGDTVTFSVTMTNDGPSTSQGATIIDDLPQGMTPTAVYSTAVPACTIQGRRITCPLEQVVPQGTQVIQIVAKISEDQPTSTMINNAEVVPGAESDRDDTNNTAHASVVVTGGDKGPYLSVRKTVTTKDPHSSSPVTYSVRVTNTGSAGAANVRLSDLPSGNYSLISIDPSQGNCDGLRCSLGTLKKGEHATITIKVSLPGGTMTNTVFASTPGYPTNSDSATVDVETDRSKIAISAAVSDTQPAVGQKVRVSFRVRNVSRAFANAVRVCAPIPSKLRFSSASGGGRASKGTVCWGAGDLAPDISGESASGNSPRSVTVSYWATVTSGGTTRAAAWARGSNVTTVTGAASLSTGGGITG
uniref:Unannotated protein n=1 Tax=freshwater metagenome TaxID=449393 RepID=A0A6J5Z5M7_9ZZZZ